MSRSPTDRDGHSEARRAAQPEAASPGTAGAEPPFCCLSQPEDRRSVIEEIVTRVSERFEFLGGAVASLGNQLEASRESFERMAEADMMLAGEVRDRTRGVADRQDALAAGMTDKVDTLKAELAVLVALELQKLQSGQAIIGAGPDYYAGPRRAAIESQIRALEKTVRDADKRLAELGEADPGPDSWGANTRIEIAQVRAERDIALRRIAALREEF